VTTQTGPAGAQNASVVSSYAVNRNETLTAISPNVPADATSWHAIAPDGRFVYTSNPRSGSNSGFSVSLQGALTPIAGTVLYSLPTGSSNLDTAVSSDSRFLYTLSSSRVATVSLGSGRMV
jgi:6-phosphogluconolactonase